jgi:hypothetical protein
VARNVKPEIRQIRGKFRAYHKFYRGSENLNISAISIIAEIDLPPNISTLILSEIGFDPD